MVDRNNPAKYQVLFLPSYLKGKMEQRIFPREAAHRLGEDIETICGGNGTCGKGTIRILENTSQKDNINSHLDHLSPPTDCDIGFYKKRRKGLRRNVSFVNDF